MGQIRSHPPVKLTVGIITAVPDLFFGAHQRLSAQFGRIDFASDLLPFDYTTYYEAEMGKDLKRQFVSFEKLIPAEELASAKYFSNAVECEFAKGDTAPRPVNLDPGYISAAKLVLASTKDHAHRIYLQDGIYAEITLKFYCKSFQSWEWTYPDYRTSTYIDIFNHIRRIYMEQLRATGLSPHPF